ncbi:hypothetical protein VTP01DRAFT_8340 [Rhizomucor pusillus]|uniref:uncharacterized protein n=1 Tax=Rhizomucor pusillus TaxID=4840 RepID=UPI003743500F
MLATSSVMIESRADSSNARRHSFSSFMRHLLFLMSPSSSNGHNDAASSSSSSSSSSNSSPNGPSDKSKTDNSLFLEMYFSFPALEDPESETNSINHCAVEQRASSSNFMYGSNTVLC